MQRRAKILQGVGQKLAKEGWFDAQQTQFLVVGLAIFCYGSLHLLQALKTKDYGVNLIIILLVPFYSQRSQFLGVWTKKHKKRHLL
jgi:hypothetical protein